MLINKFSLMTQFDLLSGFYEKKGDFIQYRKKFSN